MASLKVALDRLGLKQNELARLLGVSARTVSMWATGETPVPGPVLAYLRVLQALPAEALAAELNQLDGRNQMLDEGIYHVVYKGETNDEGAATLVLRNGKISGTDIAGGSFDGTYVFDPATGLNTVMLAMRVPPGVELVTGLSSGPFGATVPILANLKRAAPRSTATVNVAGRPVEVQLTFLRPLPNQSVSNE
jgi:transcriptional regulator with XRE-family HTH domain